MDAKEGKKRINTQKKRGKRMEKAGRQRKTMKDKGLFCLDGVSDVLLDECQDLWTVPARRLVPEMASSSIRSWKRFETAWTNIWLDSCVCAAVPVEIVAPGK